MQDNILDQGWGAFRRQLQFKQNRLTEAKFVCVECGFAESADCVGALNILERGSNRNADSQFG